MTPRLLVAFRSSVTVALAVISIFLSSVAVAQGQSRTADSPRDTAVVSESLWYGAGRKGQILKSVDQGQTWTLLNTGTDADLSSIAFFGPQLGLACGDRGTMLRTTDGGASWTLIPTGIEEPLRGLFFVDRTTAYAVTTKWVMVKSGDAGQSWTAVSTRKPEPKKEAAPAPKEEPRPEPKKEEPKKAPAPEPAPVAKEEPKPEPKPAVKEEPKPEPAPVAKVEPKPEPTPVAKVEPKPEPAPVVIAEPKPEPAPVAKVEPKPEPVQVVKEEPKNEPAPVVKAEPKPLAKPAEPAKNALNAMSKMERDTLVTRQIRHLSSMWEDHKKRIGQEGASKTVTDMLPTLYGPTVGDSVNYAKLNDRLIASRIDRQKRDVGFSAAGSYQENSTAGISSDELIIYRRRLQAGIDWDILQAGLVQSLHRKKVLENERIINALTLDNRGRSVITVQRIRYMFNRLRLDLGNRRRQLVEDVIPPATELYQLKYLPKLDLMNLAKNEVDVQGQNYLTERLNEDLQKGIDTSGVPMGLPPVFDINEDVLFGKKMHLAADSVLKLRIRNLELSNSPWHVFSLRGQVRYNFYNYSGLDQPERYFISGGLNFSFPLPLRTGATSRSVKAEAEMMRYEANKAKAEDERLMSDVLIEYRDLLSQYEVLVEKLKMAEEKIRAEGVRKQYLPREFNPLDALAAVDEYYATRLMMVDVQEQMYLALAEAHALSPGSNITELVAPEAGSAPVAEPTTTPNESVQPAAVVTEPVKTEAVTDSTAKPTTAPRSVYMWSDAVTKADPARFKELVKTLNTNRVMLSVGKADKDKVNKLIAAMNEAGARAELLIGNNELINRFSPYAYFDSLLAGLDESRIVALHLDVEPQTFPDWDSKKDIYLGQYVSMLKKARLYTRSRKMELSVAVPTSFPEERLREIYRNADRVYIMAYETTDLYELTRRVREEVSIDRSKSTIVLRTRDFTSIDQLNAFAEAVRNALDGIDISIHDLESLLRLQAIDDQKGTGPKNNKN